MRWEGLGRNTGSASHREFHSQPVLTVTETSFKTPSFLQLFTAFLISFFVSKPFLGPNISCGKEIFIQSSETSLASLEDSITWSTWGSDWAPGLSGGVTCGRSLSLLVLQVPHLETGMIMVLNSWSCRED